MTTNRRLIELSIPLDEISAQSAREKPIRHKRFPRCIPGE